jgi:predicted RNA-binding protein with PUA-like domain
MQKNLIDYLPSRIWLMKSEPDVFSFFDLEQRDGQVEQWDGVRNYQARNFMQKDMQEGDKVLFYHSNATPPGIAGIAEVVEKAKPDLTALNPKSEYYDSKATLDNPRWFAVSIGKPQKLPKFVSLTELRKCHEIKDMLLLRKGQRLSILPVSQAEFNIILQLSGFHK